MKNSTLFGMALLVASVSAAGCGSPTGGPKVEEKKKDKAAKKDEHDHGHGEHDEGPHGGTIIEFGKYHGEFVVDHAKKTATVYILDGKVKNAEPIAVSQLLLSIKTPAFQTDLQAAPQEGDPKGKSSRFVGTHENFGKEQEFAGTISGEIDGKPYLGDFKEEEHKDHKHDKK